MAWQKSPPELVALFDSLLLGLPVQRRLMFGCPSAFVNGRLAFGLFEDKIVLRLPPFERDALLRTGGTPFAPMPGRTMKDFAVMPPSLLVDGPGLRGWLETAIRHAQSLPPKGEPESEGELPAESAARAVAKPKRAAAKAKPKRASAKAKPKRAAAKAKPKRAATKARPKRAAAAKKAARKPARKVARKGVRKPARKVAKKGVRKPARKVAKKGVRKPAAQ